MTEIEGADVFGGGTGNYYTVDTAEVVQIEPSHIGSDITGDVSYTVTQVGTSTQVGYISDAVKATIKANATDTNQLEIPKDTVGFFEVQVSAKADAANKSSKILLAAGRIAIPDAAIAMQSTAATGITVDTTNKTVLHHNWERGRDIYGWRAGCKQVCKLACLSMSWPTAPKACRYWQTCTKDQPHHRRSNPWQRSR